MYKEIVICTKRYLDERIDTLKTHLELILKGTDNMDDDSGYTKAFRYAIKELKKVRNEMLNTCDYGIWLKEHKEE